jgi:integrase/recombinase XerD
MSPLRKQMQDDLVVRGMSPRTLESYTGAVAALAKYYRRRPDRISAQEVQRYLLHLIQEKGLAWSSCNIALSGLKFFYRVTLKRTQAQFELPTPRQPQKLPQILAPEEVVRIIESADNPKHRAILMTTYAAGLRLSEVCHLKVSNIDSARMTIHVEQGKGAQDRYTPLSPRLLTELRRYWTLHRPKSWLFPGARHRDIPIQPSTVQRIFKRAKARAGITKECGIHGLRHAFATHLLEAGVDVPTIQHMMGHGHIGSTLRYFHLARKHLGQVPSPLDILPRPEPKPRS